MENVTLNSPILQLEGLKVSEAAVYPVFSFFLLSYVFIMVTNVGISVVIAVDRSLHQPMYLLFCSLSVSDMIGSTHIVPHILSNLLLPPPQRLIGYYECVVQAFVTHLFATTTHTVLMAMAFDRYVAICEPLRYSSIMTGRMVLQLTAAAWGVAFLLVSILLGLTIRLNRCRSLITNPYCDNASLFKLSCESVFINNAYGLSFTVLLLSSSIGSILVTYSRIAVACLRQKNRALNSKALKTCSTHLLVYVIILASGFTIIVLHRFPQHSDLRKLAAIVFVLVPGSLNPFIYAVQSKEIRRFLSHMIPQRKVKPIL